MVDRQHIGRCSPPFLVEVEKGQLRLFAKAIGETNPLYVDEAAAQRAGYRSLPVPPTLLFGLALEQPEPFAWFTEVGLDLPRVLHGEQSFTYHTVACAGDRLRVEHRIADIYEKVGGACGALQFVVRETRISTDSGAPVADLRSVFIQPESAGR